MAPPSTPAGKLSTNVLLFTVAVPRFRVAAPQQSVSFWEKEELLTVSVPTLRIAPAFSNPRIRRNTLLFTMAVPKFMNAPPAPPGGEKPPSATMSDNVVLSTVIVPSFLTAPRKQNG